MIHRLLFAVAFVIVLLPLHPCQAQGKARLVRETAEYVIRKFGNEAGHEGIETLAHRIAAFELKYGDKGLIAVQKVGPRAFHLVAQAGKYAPQSVKLMAKYGDDAIWIVTNPNRISIFAKFGDSAAEAMMKHGEIAEPLLQLIGKPAASALNAVSPRSGRRLAMLAKDGHLDKLGRTPEVLGVVTKYGDRAMDFIWRNKGSLAVAAALAAFLANPEPFLDGTTNIADIVAKHTVKPLVDVPGRIASEAAKQTNWTAVVLSAFCVVGVVLTFRMWLRHRGNSIVSQASRTTSRDPCGIATEKQGG
ncbi:MAG: hypothetical protein KY476_01005 [Planctomycetes bacterium]|nr:hypothetical protein [Planctomycetota bacterium]